jgi:hypothetical protein
MSGFVLGRPGPRFCEPSYLLATRRRYQRRIVSGVMMPATSARRCRPSVFPFRASRRRWSSVRRTSRTVCRAENPVLLQEVLDDVLVLSIDPAGEHQEQEGERGRQPIHGAVYPVAHRIQSREDRSLALRGFHGRSFQTEGLTGLSGIRPQPSFRTSRASTLS